MTKRAALYLRVSTQEQTCENQRLKLQEVADRAGWTVIETFEDAGISGSKGRDKRPAFDRLCKAVARREVDMVLVWSVDRLGRSLRDLVNFLTDLEAVECGLYLDQQGLDSSTAAGRAMFGMLSIFAEFERSLIVERVHAGLDRAKAQGKVLGRPKTMEDETAHAIREAREGGLSFRKVAKEFGVSVSAVQRAVAVP